MDVLNPEKIVVSTNIGEIDKEAEDWLKKHTEVQCFYTTLDSECISATIEEDDVYLGFYDTNCYKKVNDNMYNIPEEYVQYSDYSKYCYKLNYKMDSDTYNTITVTNFNDLKQALENDERIHIDQSSNKYVMVMNNEDKEIKIKPLLVKLSGENNNWTANESIKIKENQNIRIINDIKDTSITVKRGSNLIKLPIFEINGMLDIGQKNMNGKITIDGAGDDENNKVIASSPLIKIDQGYLKMYENVTMCNNVNKINEDILNKDENGIILPVYSTSYLREYSVIGSGIYCKLGEIYMEGGIIQNNKQINDIKFILPETIAQYHYFDTLGSGIYLENHSKLTITNGKINNNSAINNSIIYTDINKPTTTTALNRGITQNIYGVGIYSTNSKINLFGGEIFQNEAINNAETFLNQPVSGETNIYSISKGINGVGIYVDDSNLSISNGFEIKSSNAIINKNEGNEEKTKDNITYGDNTKVSQHFISAIRGVQGYFNNTMVDINGLNVDGQNSNVINHTNINKENSSNNINIDVSNNGGGLVLKNCTNFIIKDLNINNCRMDAINNGGAIFLNSCSGIIEGDSSFCNNNVIGKGGSIYINSSDIDIKNINLKNNSARFGGAIYSNVSNTNLENVKICNNSSTGSGGGIGSFGTKLIIMGDNTEISGNQAATFGGGISINTSVVEFNGGKIKENSANTYGDGVGIYSGEFIQNGGTITNEIGINIENDGKYIIYSGEFNGSVSNQEGTLIRQPDEKNYIDKRKTSENGQQESNTEEEEKEKEKEQEEEKQEEKKQEKEQGEKQEEKEKEEEQEQEEQNADNKKIMSSSISINKIDSTKSEKKLPKTGKKMWLILVVSFIMFLFSAIF